MFKWIAFYGEKGKEFALSHASSFKLLSLFGWSVRINRFTSPDVSGYHSHPAKAFRLVLWGGYKEKQPNGFIKTWKPGMFGIVKPELTHQIFELLNGKSSYSLWIRAPHTHKVLFVPEERRWDYLHDPKLYKHIVGHGDGRL